MKHFARKYLHNNKFLNTFLLTYTKGMMNTRASIDRSIFYSLNDKGLLRSIFPEDFLNTIRWPYCCLQ